MDLTTSVDGTIPIQALLLDDEDLICSQAHVGIYSDLTTKSPNHQAGTAHLTSHRLFYIDNTHPRKHSFSLSLGLVGKTEYYAGLFTSSAKVSLFVSSNGNNSMESSEWTCSVCGNRNGPGLSRVCGLCGVEAKEDLGELGCRVCTFINASGATKCEMCDSPLGQQSLLRLSFRRGGDKTFYNDLKRALLGKAWMISRSATPAASGGGGGGIAQILSQHQSSQSSTSTSLSTALLDLEALMIKAKEMVRVANDLSDRLATLKVDDDDTNASSLLTSFSNLAISKPTSLQSTPVTQEMYKSDKAFLASLAQELSSVLVSTDTDPIIPLDRLWVKWNRARGVSLIPPSTFLDVLPLLQDTPYRLRQLGDIKILYTPHFSTASVAARLPSPVTPTSFSISEHISLPLAQLLLDEIEMLPQSPICRDDWETAIRPGGTVLEPTYYRNVFEGST
ncbi:Vacuolar protein-sorting-associated protein 36 [Marasmius sp. AFHP31]|nr:Vacuolar protein-sorting-associated protein 36 [Marasmius sp. AFHP31]